MHKSNTLRTTARPRNIQYFSESNRAHGGATTPFLFMILANNYVDCRMPIRQYNEIFAIRRKICVLKTIVYSHDIIKFQRTNSMKRLKHKAFSKASSVINRSDDSLATLT